MTWGYRTEPRNPPPMTAAEVDERVRGILRSASARGSYAPRSIPQLSLDIPIVANLPLGPQDGTEVYLRVGDDNQIAHMLYLASLPGWVQTGLPPLVTTLPTTVAVEGFRVIYDTGTAGVRWDLVYDSSDGTTYPWLYVGGPTLRSEVETQESRSSASYGALTTAGPSVTAPLDGDYIVTNGAQIQAPAGAESRMSYDIGGTGAVDADGVYIYSSGTATIEAGIIKRKLKTAVAASTALVSKYKVASGTGYFAGRYIEILPVRVGA